jgi:hypothetical protein
MAEVSAGVSNNFLNPLQRTSVAVSSVFSTFVGGNLIDGNVTTEWSSIWHSSATANEWFAFWNGTFYDISSVRLIPKIYTVPDPDISIFVPEQVNLYYSNGANWVFIKTVSLPKDIGQSGTIVDFLPVRANGIHIVSTKLRSYESYGYYFQMAEADSR